MNVGTLTLGVINGLVAGLLAVGLVLVYRANKFLNLAHGQLGALPALLLAKFVQDWGWSYWVGLPVCLAVGIGTGLVVERLFIAPLRRRTSSAMSLLLMSLAVTQLLTALAFVSAFAPNAGRSIGAGYPLPFHPTFRFGGVVFGGQDVLVLVVCPVIVAALAAFLRFSILGKMIRAAANNPDSARLCGISPRLVSLVTWAIAGGLSTLSAVLVSPSQTGQFNPASFGPDQLLVALGAAAFGAFVSVPLALAGGLVIGVVNQVVLAQTSNGGDARLVVFVLILIVVFARGRALAAAFGVGGAAMQDRAPLRVPPAVRDRFVVRAAGPTAATAAVLLALALPYLAGLSSEGHRFELTLVLIYALVAISLTILLGWGGQLSLGHFAVVGLGAFVTGRLVPHGWTITPLLLLAAAIGAATMALVGLPALRVRGLTLAVTTLGFAVVGSEWLFHTEWLTGTPGTVVTVDAVPVIRGTSTSTSQLSRYLLTLVVVVVVALLVRELRRSTAGRLMIAVRDNEAGAAAHGVTPVTTKLANLMLSGGIAGMAGVLWADTWRSVTPDQFAPTVSLAVLAVPVIGGLGSVAGAIAGAAALYLPTYFISPHLSALFGHLSSELPFQLALAGLGMAGVLLAYPTGIAGAAQHAWERLLARLAEEVREPIAAVAAEAAPVLVARDVHVSFGGIRALQGASIEVAAGEIVGLIGPNGAGKSTLVNVISGALRPDRGSIHLLGMDVARFAPEVRAGLGMGRSFQAASLFPGLTVRETVEAVLGARAGIGMFSSMVRAPWAVRAHRAVRADAEALVTRMGLAPWADTLTDQLSTGTRRICDLTLQLADRSRVLVLDEPTAGLAQRETEAFGPLLRRIREELDCAVLIVEHDMPLLMSICDRVYAMDAGAVIAAGTPAQIRSDRAVIASYLGTDKAAIGRSGARRDGRPKRGARVARRETAAVRSATTKARAEVDR